jgi:hypothetical protein
LFAPEKNLRRIFLINIFFFSNSVESELDSFINTSRSQRIQSTAINSPRISYYQPVMLEAQSELNFNTVEPLRSFSPDDLEKLKYKIDLGERF